jgi:MoaA/NifB/PqqE/SkfB family radical SAM enzyme
MTDISPFNPWKILYHRDSIDMLIEADMPDPVCMSIDPTNICNQNCIWCFVSKYRKANPVSLSKEVLYDFIDEIRGRVKAITYSGGGDPLMNPATIDVIKYAGLDFEQGLTTNGTPPVDAHGLDIISYYCDFIRVSIDAVTGKTYFRLHKSNLFWTAIRFVNEMVKRKRKHMEVNVSFMICPTNLNEVIPAVELFREMGINKLIFKFVYSDYPGIHPGFSTKDFITKNKAKINTIIDRAKSMENKEFKVLFRHPQVFDKMKLVHQSKLYKKCWVAPLNQAGLAADGNIHLCCDRRGELILGNIKKQRFFDMWGSNKHFQMMHDIKLAKCPTRCRITDMNQIVEAGFIDDTLDWDML